MPDAVPKRATITELSRTGGGLTDLSDGAIRRHIRQARLAKGADGKYNTKAVLSAILKHQAADNRNVAVPDSTMGKIAATKGALDCQYKQEQLRKLRIEINILESDYIKREDAQGMIGELVASFRHALENRVQQVASETDDPDRLAAEEDLRDKTLQWAQERIEG